MRVLNSLGSVSPSIGDSTLTVMLAEMRSGRMAPSSPYQCGWAAKRVTVNGPMFRIFMSIFSMGSIRTVHGEGPAGVPQARLAACSLAPVEVCPCVL